MHRLECLWSRYAIGSDGPCIAGRRKENRFTQPPRRTCISGALRPIKRVMYKWDGISMIIAGVPVWPRDPSRILFRAHDRLANGALLEFLDSSCLNVTWRRGRLRAEVDHLLELVASGVSVDTIAPKIREREAALARVDARLRLPRPAPPDKERLRAALEKRVADWKSELRAEPKIARLVLRRLIGPITLHDESTRPEFVRWVAPKSRPPNSWRGWSIWYRP